MEKPFVYFFFQQRARLFYSSHNTCRTSRMYGFLYKGANTDSQFSKTIRLVMAINWNAPCNKGSYLLIPREFKGGGSRIFLRRGAPLSKGKTDCRIPVTLESRMSSLVLAGWWGRGHTPFTLPLDPPL